MEQTRKTPVQLIQDNLGTFAIAGLIFMIISGISANLPDNIVMKTLSTLLSAVFAASQASFYFRAINRQKPDIADFYNIFTVKEDTTKLLAVIIAKFIIDMAINIMVAVLDFLPMLGFAASVVSMIVSLMFIPVLYLFVANPQYSTVYYFKASMEYMTGNMLKYLGTVLKYIIPLVLGYIAMLVFLPIVGVYTGAVYVMFGISRLDLAVAYFIADNVIPDEWYNGTAQL